LDDDAAPEFDRMDQDPVDPVEVVLAIGANLGDAQATLREAVTDLDRLPGIQVMEVSPLARTVAVGGPEQPDFLNAVLIARTTLSPRGLLRATQAVENAHGRVREERWGPRTLDVDIVRYGSLVARTDDLELPHPRACERAFVLVPWAEVQPDADLPGLGGGPVARLAETAPDRAGIRWMALDWLTEPQPADEGPATGAAAPAAATERSAEQATEQAPEQAAEWGPTGAPDPWRPVAADEER
jgi:dihydroneopterin aldolase/2-amino-4-hydroxy-6-hydroxymethyldihydropteridine diphosphokinase